MPPPFRDSLRILFIAPYVPSLVRPRPFHFVRGLLARGHEVSVVALAASAEEARLGDHLDALGAAVHVVVPRRRAARAVATWLTGPLPLHVAYCQSAEMFALVNGLGGAGDARFDVVHVEHVRAGLYGRDLTAPAKVFDAVDCHSRLLTAAAAGGPTRWERRWARADLRRTRILERALNVAYPAVLAASDADRQALEELGCTRSHVLANGVDLEYFHPMPDGERRADTLVFVGRLGYHANRRALQSLLDDVMPRVWRVRPRARLLVVGERPPAFVRRAAARQPDRLTVTGSVPDVRPYLAEASVAVCPMPYAVGVQNKVLEAMATATALVADPAACSALDVEHGEQVLVGRGADDFASRVVELLADGAARARLGQAARTYVERHHRWDDAVRRLESIYAEQLEAPRAASGTGV